MIAFWGHCISKICKITASMATSYMESLPDECQVWSLPNSTETFKPDSVVRFDLNRAFGEFCNKKITQLWKELRPLLMVVTLSLTLSVLAKVVNSGIPVFVFYISILWYHNGISIGVNAVLFFDLMLFFS